MIREPFSIFHPFKEILTVALWTRKDDATVGDTSKMIGTGKVAHSDQVHAGDVMRVFDRTTDPLPAVDALTTDEKNLLLLSKSADCQTFVFFDPEKMCIAVAHAGWKGLLTHVIQHTINQMTREWNTDPEDLLVGAAPSLGLCCSKFSDPEKELPGIDHSFFHENHVDLQGIAERQLQDAGVLRGNIDRMTLCTKCNSGLLWSYRADPEPVRNAHRNFLGVMIKK